MPETKNTLLERKFLHSLATPLTIALLMLKKSLQECSQESVYSDDHKKRLERALKSLKEIEELHAAYKEGIYKREVA